MTRRLNIEGWGASLLYPNNEPRRRVAWKRHTRAYQPLRQLIDDRYLETSTRRDIEPLELPLTLQGWRPRHSMAVRRLWPDLGYVVDKIEALLKERDRMRADRTYIPPPNERGAKRMERARMREYYAHLDPANRRNFDLIGL
jgi:hypothetical protein